MSGISTPGFPEAEVRRRAALGAAAVFPERRLYGVAAFGREPGPDALDAISLVPPVFVPGRLAKLIELNREPLYSDVNLTTNVGGFDAPLPVYISAFGSTEIASGDIALAVSRQAGALGIPLVIGENVVPINGFRCAGTEQKSDTVALSRTMLERIGCYLETVPDGLGGVVVQQSTEDADAEVWNRVYSDPTILPLLETGRLAMELKVGQGAKPGIGGVTLLSRDRAAELDEHYHLDPIVEKFSDTVVRHSSPGTFTEEILRQQIRLMRSNYPRCKVWVKLPPARDVAVAASVAWSAGADSVTVDGAEAGTGWAPIAFLEHAGLPLVECLRRIAKPLGCLLVSGRMFDGPRIVKSLALGASAVGLGRAALLAADEDAETGLSNLIASLRLEMQLLISALGRYNVADLGEEDLWCAGAQLKEAL